MSNRYDNLGAGDEHSLAFAEDDCNDEIDSDDDPSQGNAEQEVIRW